LPQRVSTLGRSPHIDRGLLCDNHGNSTQATSGAHSDRSRALMASGFPHPGDQCWRVKTAHP